MYERLNNKDEREVLVKELSRKKNLKKFLNDFTGTFNLTELIYRWYLHFNPEKADYEFIDELREKYVLCDDVLINTLYRAYVDKDYKRREQQLWLVDPPCPRE